MRAHVHTTDNSVSEITKISFQRSTQLIGDFFWEEGLSDKKSPETSLKKSVLI